MYLAHSNQQTPLSGECSTFVHHFPHWTNSSDIGGKHPWTSWSRDRLHQENPAEIGQDSRWACSGLRMVPAPTSAVGAAWNRCDWWPLGNHDKKLQKIPEGISNHFWDCSLEVVLRFEWFLSLASTWETRNMYECVLKHLSVWQYGMDITWRLGGCRLKTSEDITFDPFGLICQRNNTYADAQPFHKCRPLFNPLPYLLSTYESPGIPNHAPPPSAAGRLQHRQCGTPPGC